MIYYIHNNEEFVISFVFIIFKVKPFGFDLLSFYNSNNSELLGILMPSSSFEINNFDTKASQFNHFDGTYTKKTLSQRWNDFNGIKIQRDMYSAFLIINISDDLKSFDNDIF